MDNQKESGKYILKNIDPKIEYKIKKKEFCNNKINFLVLIMFKPVKKNVIDVKNEINPTD